MQIIFTKTSIYITPLVKKKKKGREEKKRDSHLTSIKLTIVPMSHPLESFIVERASKIIE